jgi:hypothetical protein
MEQSIQTHGRTLPLKLLRTKEVKIAMILLNMDFMT